MVRPDLDERFRRSKLHRYLLADETVLIAQRQHWAKVGEPVASAVAGLVVVLILNFLLPASLLTDLLWWAWLALALRALSKYVLWRREWLVATDKRLMVNYGLIHQGVSMFSLSRVTDVTYMRSTVGQVLGYGTLKREGTGRDQTLHDIRFVDHPHATYTTVCAAIFELQDRMFGMDDDEYGHRFEDGPPRHAPGLYAEYVPPEDRTGKTGPTSAPARAGDGSQEEPDTSDESPGIMIRYGASIPTRREPSYESPDLRESPASDDNTGPIPYRRSATDPDTWRPTTDEDGR